MLSRLTASRIRVVLGLHLAVLGLVGSIAAGQAGAAAPPIDIKIDPSEPGREFDGVGGDIAGSAYPHLYYYPEAEREEILDYLFKPRYGASLQVLKVEIGGDVNTTTGSESSHQHSRSDLDCDRGYQWWFMKEAVRRNPELKIGALPIGAPGWIGDGTSFYSDDQIEYRLNWLRCARQHGLRIHNMGIRNEAPYDAEWIKKLKAALVAEGFGRTKVIAADIAPGVAGHSEDPSSEAWLIARDMAADPALRNAVDIIGVHYAMGQSTNLARQLNKPLWVSEDGPWGSQWGKSSTSSFPCTPLSLACGALSAAYPALLNRNYVAGRFTSTQIWSPIIGYYSNGPFSDAGLFQANTPWSGAYEIRSPLWAVAHTTQFAEPGWRYIDSASGYFSGTIPYTVLPGFPPPLQERLIDTYFGPNFYEGGSAAQDAYLGAPGSYVTLRAPGSKHRGSGKHHGFGVDYSTIIETMRATAPQRVNVTLAGGASRDRVHVWRTDATRWFERIGDIKPKNGRFSLTVEPDAVYSLTTTTGQHKGRAQGDSPASFPFPYRDDFERTHEGQQPRYFAQQHGAFEAGPCPGSWRNGCVTQTAPQVATFAWPPGSLPNSTPHGIIGDPEWTDYRVSIDFRIQGAGSALVEGRGNVPSIGGWNGYRLVVDADGSWTLNVGATVLASGTVGGSVSGWHAMSLDMVGNDVIARLDGRQLARVADTARGAGQAGFGSGWNAVSFDNLRIDRL